MLTPSLPFNQAFGGGALLEVMEVEVEVMEMEMEVEVMEVEEVMVWTGQSSTEM